MSDLYISNLTFDFGEKRSIKDLAPWIPEDPLDMFRAGGLEFFTEVKRDAFQIAMEMAGSTLGQADVDPESITDVVFTTSTQFGGNKDLGLSTRLSLLSGKLGLNHARVYAISAAECGNFIHVLRFCEQALKENAKSKILVLFVEKLLKNEERHLDNITILSDGVAACLISGEYTPGSYQMLTRSEITNHKVSLAYADERQMEALKFTAEGLRKLQQEVFEKSGLSENDIRYIITNNYSMNILKMFCTESGMDAGKLCAPTLAEYAHAFAIDNLLNLDATDLNDGDKLYCLSTGIFFWGACVLKYCA